MNIAVLIRVYVFICECIYIRILHMQTKQFTMPTSPNHHTYRTASQVNCRSTQNVQVLKGV